MLETLDNYLSFREIGFGRKESFRRSMNYFISSLIPSLSHYDGWPSELEMENRIIYVERSAKNFDEFVLKESRNLFEYNLFSLYTEYSKNPNFFSKVQGSRIENILEKIPPKIMEKLEEKNRQDKKKQTYLNNHNLSH